MQCACVILSSVTFLAVEYFTTLSLRRHDFRKRVIKYKIYVLIFSVSFFEKFLILKRNERDIIRIVYWYSFKVPVILVRF